MNTKLAILADSKQLAIAGTHNVVLDRGADQGGEDAGFRAGELWLISLSGCIGGSLNQQARRQYEYAQAVNHVTAEDTVNEKGQITSIAFTLTFADEVKKEHRDRLLHDTRANCKLLNTVGPHIEVTLQQHSHGESFVAAGAGCHLQDGSCCN